MMASFSRHRRRRSSLTTKELDDYDIPLANDKQWARKYLLDPLTAPEPSQETGPGSSFITNYQTWGESPRRRSRHHRHSVQATPIVPDISLDQLTSIFNSAASFRVPLPRSTTEFSLTASGEAAPDTFHDRRSCPPPPRIPPSSPPRSAQQTWEKQGSSSVRYPPSASRTRGIVSYSPHPARTDTQDIHSSSSAALADQTVASYPIERPRLHSRRNSSQSIASGQNDPRAVGTRARSHSRANSLRIDTSADPSDIYISRTRGSPDSNRGLRRSGSVSEYPNGDMSHRSSGTPHQGGHTPRRTRRPAAPTDTIDGLDDAAIGGAYHHDGPFDAALASRNRNPKYSPLAAVHDSNMAALRATPREFVQDSLTKHVPLQGTAMIPAGHPDFQGNVMDYEEGTDLMREADAGGGAYKRWDGVKYLPEDLKGKGEPSYSIEAAERQKKLHKRSVSTDPSSRYELRTGLNRIPSRNDHTRSRPRGSSVDAGPSVLRRKSVSVHRQSSVRGDKKSSGVVVAERDDSDFDSNGKGKGKGIGLGFRRHFGHSKK